MFINSRDLKAAGVCCATGRDGRRVLYGVLCEALETQGPKHAPRHRLTATDGKRGIIITREQATEDAKLPPLLRGMDPRRSAKAEREMGSFILPKEACKRAASLGAPEEVLEVTPGKDPVDAVQIAVPTAKAILSDTPIVGKYPDIANVWPKPDGRLKLVVNARYMASVLTAIANATENGDANDSVEIYLDREKANAPILFRGDLGAIEAIVMPIQQRDYCK